MKRTDISAEKYEGLLDFLTGYNRNKEAIMLRSNWKTIKTFWLQIIKGKSFDKPSIITLLDIFSTNVQLHFINKQLKYFINEVECFKIAEKFVKTSESQKTDKGKQIEDDIYKLRLPSEEEIKTSKELATKKYQENVKYYHELIIELTRCIETLNLHWRDEELAFIFLSVLIRHDIDYPKEAVNRLLLSLNHQTLIIRKERFP